MSANATSVHATPFCPQGGTWEAVQSLIAFLITNVLAHAATIRTPAGISLSALSLLVIKVILHPVLGGHLAFSLLGRWMSRLRKRGIQWPFIFGGERLSEAVISGTLAISVPLKFAPLLVGRLRVVENSQEILLLDHKEFRSPTVELPFRPAYRCPRYLPFILPASTRFTDKFEQRDCLIPPSSNLISQFIGLFQIFAGGRQLYLNYGSSVSTYGLASPYLIVIPYLLMTVVNLIASVLCGSYTHVTILPMKRDKVPKYNEVYITGNRVFTLAKKPTPTEQPSSDTVPKENLEFEFLELTNIQGYRDTDSGGAAISSEMKEKMLAQVHEETTSKVKAEASTKAEGETSTQINRIESTFDEKLMWTRHNPYLVELDELPDKISRFRCSTLPEGIQSPIVAVTPAVELGVFRILRIETWNSACHDIAWRFQFGKKSLPSHLNQPVSTYQEKLKSGTVFLRQNPYSSLRVIRRKWCLAMRQAHTDTDLKEFRAWLEENYPGLDIGASLKEEPRLVQKAAMLWSLGVMLFTTILLGSLARFRIGIISHAIWFLVWMYGGPIIATIINIAHLSGWLVLGNMFSPSLLKWLVHMIIYWFSLVVGIFSIGAITVLSVELFGAMCGVFFSLPVASWVLIGVLIYAGLILVFLIFLIYDSVMEKLYERLNDEEMEDQNESAV